MAEREAHALCAPGRVVCIKHRATLRGVGPCSDALTTEQIDGIMRDSALVSVRALAEALLVERARAEAAEAKLRAVQEAARALVARSPQYLTDFERIYGQREPDALAVLRAALATVGEPGGEG